MSLISAIVTVIFVHLGVTTFAQTDGSGPRCLSCNNIVNPATCRTVKECWNGESCFSEELLAENGTRIFNFGCKKNQECSRPKRFLSNGIVVHVCHHCCLQDLCNLNACFSTVDLACYSCRDKADPRDCFGIQLCADNEVCYAETVIGEGARPVHTMGCATTALCGLIPQSSPIPRRDVHLCQRCCSSQGCNLNICPK